MSLKDIKRRAELASLEIAAGGDEWWASQSKAERKAYIEKHPKSKYAKKMSVPIKKAEPKTGTKKPSGPAERGPKFIKDAKREKTKTPVVKTTKPKVAEKPTKTSKPDVKPEVKKTTKPATKPASKSKNPSSRGRPPSVSPKQKIKMKMEKVKDLQARLTVLAAEKSWRSIARSYTKRDTTKERLAERIKKIGELTKNVQTRIKNYEKRIKELQASI
jgi:hypothetical protein